MHRLFAVLLVAAALPASTAGLAQTAPADTTAVPAAPAATAAPAPEPAPAPRAKGPSRIYCGGGIGVAFWNDYTRISVEPMVGLKMTPKLSVGAKVGYEYLNDRRLDYEAHNYGFGAFSRYRLIPALYAHAELDYWGYDYSAGREWVPFLLLGGGYSQPMGRNAWLTAEILFDVLNDENSPYDSGEPRITFGVGVGF